MRRVARNFVRPDDSYLLELGLRGDGRERRGEESGEVVTEATGDLGGCGVVVLEGGAELGKMM
jgi:hypothetical protein